MPQRRQVKEAVMNQIDHSNKEVQVTSQKSNVLLVYHT